MINLSPNPIGVITTLLKKGLTENSSSNVVCVITTLLKKGLTKKTIAKSKLHEA
ncbi:hypothetical protein [Methanosarcina barkeri]|uniref:hypothetical protein n=1 Tax=Methanosarcina barkeri TaxID=2208 RepID=UPI00003C68CA|nr:hypothetical protein [Methanosarcina barkeri]